MLNNLESLIGDGLKSFSIFAPILALLGGILTSISPCSLASIPLVIGYMTGTKEDDTKRAFKTSVVFAIGMAITYTSKKTGYVGALIVGIMAGLFSSPCSTPILVALLAIVASKGSLLWGVLLFLLYSIGNSILVIVAGTSTGFVGKVMSNKSYGKISDIVKIVFGIIILLIGLYFLYLGF